MKHVVIISGSNRVWPQLKLLPLFLLLTFFQDVLAQSPDFSLDADSMTVKDWQEEVPGYGIKDTNYVLALLKLGTSKKDSRDKLEIFESAYALSKNLNYSKGIVNSIFWTSNVYHYELGDLDSASSYYEAALYSAQKYNFNVDDIYIKSKVGQAQIDLSLGNTKRAIEGLLDALDQCDSSFIYERTVIYHTLSNIHYELGDFRSGLSYLELTAESMEEDPIKDHHYAQIYIDYAMRLFESDKVELAIKQLERARFILDNGPTVDFVESIYWKAISVIELNRNSQKNALIAAEKSYEFSKKGNNREAHMVIINNFLYILNGIDDTDHALIEELIDEGDKTCDNLASNTLLKNYLKQKHVILAAKNKWSEAYQTIVTFDSIEQIFHENDITEQSSQLQKEIADLESQKTLVAREKELVEQDAKLERSNLYFVISVFGFLLFATIGLLFFIRYKSRTVLGRLQLENKLLRVQINPHFIYNVLANIKSLIFESPEKAETYTLTFARLLRKVLEQSREEYIPLNEELQLLHDYVTLQETRLNKEVEYIVELDEGIIANEIAIPPLVLQPLVENAVEHGFRNGVQEAYILELKFILEPKYLEVQVIDNGPGLGNTERKAKHRSLATQIIRDQIQIFRKTNRSKVFDLIVKKRSEIDPGKDGTIAMIRIPYKKQ